MVRRTSFADARIPSLAISKTGLQTRTRREVQHASSKRRFENPAPAGVDRGHGVRFNTAPWTSKTPDDYLHPDWDRVDKVHDWRNHVSDEVQDLWLTFTEPQRAALARQAQELAAREEWE